MVTRRERQQRRAKRVGPVTEPVAVRRPASRKGLDAFYHDHYKQLIFIPFLLLTLALLQIGFQFATTGDFLHKGVSLSGGLTLTVPVVEQTFDLEELESALLAAFPERDIVVRGISELGELRGVTIQVATEEEGTVVQELERDIMGIVDTRIPGALDEYSVEIVGSSLGESFFQQTLKAIAIAFILMGVVIFLYFGHNVGAKTAAVILSLIASLLVFKATGTVMLLFAAFLALILIILYVRYSPPSAAVILAAFSDIVITLAIVNFLGIKLSTAGIAAFLMLIGYSVDTDILLSTRVLKRSKGSVYERIIDSMKTGMLMSLTSAAAALIGVIVSRSETIKQIMLIILIGLIVDIIVTWLQNAGIIRLYAERRKDA